MPEGDSIWNLATRLQKMVGREVVAFSARKWPNDVAKTLIGHTITKIEAQGKNLLIRFDDHRLLHIHLRMEGRVFFEKPRSTFWKPLTEEPDVRLAVKGAPALIGKRLPVLRLLTAKQEQRAEDLSALGPDLCKSDWDEDEALKRYRAMEDREIADALLVQRAVAGIGNVYKSEVLFLEHVAPRTMLSAVSDEKLLAILRRASVLLRRNLRPGPRTTRPNLGSARLWVYSRGQKPCLVCSTPIERFMQGPLPGRSTYWCPKCQPANPV